MSTFGLIEYNDASPEVRAVYDDIMATRKTDWINNFWKALAHDPVTAEANLGRHQADHGARRAGCVDEGDALRRGQRDQSAAPTASPRIRSSARNKGMTDDMFHELMSVVGMANETNRLVNGYQIEIDDAFKTPLK